MRKNMKYHIMVLAGLLVWLPAVSPSLKAQEVADSLLEEKVYLPINQAGNKFTTTGSARSWSGETISKYPGANLKNSLTGVIPGLFVTENSGAPGVMYGQSYASLQVRGFGLSRIVVDDVVIRDIESLPLNPEEIESITVVSDILDKARLGPEVSRGTIYIKTLRGLNNTRKVYAGYERGVDVVGIMPEWVSGEEYVRLNNQARAAAGYPERFPEESFAKYALRNPLDWTYPNVDYKDLVLKNTRDYHKGYVTIRGGGDRVLYSGNLGYVNVGDIYKVGAPTNYNRFNAKMNIDLNVTPDLNVNFGFIGILSLRHSLLSAYGEWGSGQSFNNIWNRICYTPPVEFPLYLDDDEETGKRNYAVSTAYPNHPYAGAAETGHYTERTRVGMTKASVNYDFGKFIKGLRSETQISYNLSYTVRGGQGQDYVAWLYNPVDSSRTATSHQGASQSSESSFTTPSYLQGIQFHEKLLYGYSKEDFNLNTSLTYYRSKLGVSSDGAYNKQQNYIFAGDMQYRNRYLLELVANYAGTSARKRGHRYELFPAVGLGWVVSEEGFMKNLNWLDFLKVRAQAGILGYEPYGTQFYWESYYNYASGMTYGPYTTNQWFGSESFSTTSSNVARIANDGLGWEKNKEVSFGFDATLGKRWTLSYTHYNTLQDGIIVDMANVLPLFYGAVSMIDNYNQYAYWGDELSLTLEDRIGNFHYRLGGFLLHDEGRYNKYSESTPFDNLKVTGKRIGDVIAYDYIGRFATQEEADATNQTFDQQCYKGDLKYADVTGDGIVDSNDRKVIGNTRPKLQYAINLYLAWKGLDLTVVGTGKAMYDMYLTNGYFFMGAGDGNYSKFVYDPLYPRLSYVSSVNNFQLSNYWRVDGGFFKIQNVELGYNFRTKIGKDLTLNGIRLFVRGANLLTFSKVPYVDPESPSAGVSDYPLFRSFTGGIKFNF